MKTDNIKKENKFAEVKKYVYGEPYVTDAVVVDIPVTEGNPANFSVEVEKKTFTYKMTPETVVYGLGETVRGMNKRGWIYESNNSDQPHHEETTRSLYASQNFLLIWNEKDVFALFIDCPGRITWDIGYTDTNTLTITFEELNADFYIINGDSLNGVVTTFRKMIGPSYKPPKWAFGYGQSRWGYKTEEDFKEVVKNYKEAGIPIDMLYMDIDYMEGFKDFTVNKESFPDFGKFVKEMADQDIHLVPIIDAGVKIEDGYSVYEEGVANDYFCKDEEGKPFVAAVWPGFVHFPDFLKDDARKWFGDKYCKLVDLGIEGFWNDMNEPAIFYTEKAFKKASKDIKPYVGKDMDITNYYGIMGVMDAVANHDEDYKSFYHDFHGKTVRHDKVHNLYGYYMTRSAGEAFRRNYPDKDILMFSRASYVGMHRYGGVWTGDNFSWWSHLALNIAQMPSLNMCGFLFSGADLGGFGVDTTEDLLLRWIAFGIFTPLMRNHSAIGTREQEPYKYSRKQDFANLIGLRYALVPYLYSEFMKAVEENTMYFKPLTFEYTNDKRAIEVEDQLLVGDSIMVAPVYKQNAHGRMVYLPERMKLVRFRSYNDYDEEILEAGDHYVRAELNEVPVFIRPGHKLPICKPANCVAKLNENDIKYIEF